MKKFVTLILPIIIIGCAGQAIVEVGLYDESLVDAPLGDVVMRVTKIELAEDNTYNTIWESANHVEVTVQSSDFVSITESYIEITPGSYQSIRLTVDSVCYVSDSTVMLVETSYQFIANAFTQIVIDENDDLQLAITINSSSWLDTDSMKIKSGHELFEGAALRVYYGN
ncbi:MAG: hypothetical protein E3J47_07640 [Candidatus Stahlbacteria bacterium]|nr:MAG: hypothetical protein E3J47_07640 [Candidatus Stahlbacteria bacterium]